ncbi:MAG: YtxH domain-containing protein [Anaerolineae bacterium]
MENHTQESNYRVSQAGGFLAGLLAGGMIGAGAMLLLAPQSGAKTRAKFQHEGLGLRDQVTDTVEDAMAHTRGRARRIMANVHKQSKQLQQRGQDMLDEQKEVVAQVVEAEKEAAHNLTNG